MKQLSLLFCLLCSSLLFAQNHMEANYDEAQVPAYTLPPLLHTEQGQLIRNATDWHQIRRPELMDLFATHVYGTTPLTTASVSWELMEQDSNAFEGLFIRKQVRIWVEKDDNRLPLDLLLYLPYESERQPAPVILALNFYGNQSIHLDPYIRFTESWLPNNEDFGITEHRATEASRGVRQSRWPIEEILERGYGLATLYYGDIDPDFDDGFQNGIHPLFYAPGQTQPRTEEWGSIGAWAWGLSRAVDYLQTDAGVDRDRIILMGHSRLGKAALWAGAQDERFALVISNNSGCGGAALFRREYGERILRINTSFPHWFNDHFTLYNARENQLPVDQHQLIALIAPRPVYIASATEDQWADPHGEFLAGQAASSAYALYGLKGLTGDFPAPETPMQSGFIGYHLRTGRHDVTLYDWQQYMDFADKRLGRGRFHE